MSNDEALCFKEFEVEGGQRKMTNVRLRLKKYDIEIPTYNLLAQHQRLYVFYPFQPFLDGIRANLQAVVQLTLTRTIQLPQGKVRDQADAR
jgi:hypothetical protein